MWNLSSNPRDPRKSRMDLTPLQEWLELDALWLSIKDKIEEARGHQTEAEPPSDMTVEQLAQELELLRRQLELVVQRKAEIEAAWDAAENAGEHQVIEFPTKNQDISERISVAVYLDTNTATTITRVVDNLRELVEALGYGELVDSQVQRGSYFMRAWASIRRALTSDDVREISVKAERALELRYLDSEQADVDDKIAAAVAKLLSAVVDVPSVCIRAGSIMLIKYQTPQGPVVQTRNLSQLEIGALERFPEIQRVPHKALESLALAISDLTGTESP